MAWTSRLCPTARGPVVVGALHRSAVKLFLAETFNQRDKLGMTGVQKRSCGLPGKSRLVLPQVGIVPLELVPLVTLCREMDLPARLPVLVPAQEQLDPVRPVPDDIFRGRVLVILSSRNMAGSSFRTVCSFSNSACVTVSNSCLDLAGMTSSFSTRNGGGTNPGPP